MKLFRLLFIFLLVAAAQTAMAQELNCKIKIGHDKIQNTDPQVFTAMERTIMEFMNTRKWTTDEWNPAERIDCNIMINLLTRDQDQDIYTATLSIQATRPVYNSGYTSPLINYMDRDITFQLTQYNQLQFDDNRVTGPNPLQSNLTAILAYYAYLVIALDYDSFSPSGGNNMLKKAQNIVNNAPEQGTSIHGWKAFEEKRNRYWIVDQLLSPRFEDLRKYWYAYHREGMDFMYSKPAEGKAKVLGGIKTMSQLQKENPGASIIQFFFTAKSDELMRVVSQASREEKNQYIPLLSAMDVSNATKYNNLKQ